MVGGQNANKMQNSMINFKIVKCKNWEKDGTCKYGVHCTFAHGDKELRNKTENLYQMNNPMMMMPMIYDMNSMPVMFSPGMDMNQMQQMMAAGGVNQNQFMMMMPPVPDAMNNNDEHQNSEKADNNQQ
jgi:hypothetical protein